MTDDPAGGRPVDRRVTLHDVAREAGVSYATASRAVHPGTRVVSPAIRDRVLAAVGRLRYTPNFPAQAVASGFTPTVSLVVRDVADPYFSAIATGARSAADGAGLTLMMAVSGGDPERELEIVRQLRGHRPRAMVVAGSRLAGAANRDDMLAEELRAFERTGGRVVLVSQPDLPFPTVTLDNRGAGEQLARALADIGYRRIALICGPVGLRVSDDRAEGLARGAHAVGITFAERDTVRVPFTRDGGYEAARSLAERGLGDIDAIVAVNDNMAVGAMSAFRDAGLVPGRDVGVAGFDDIPTALDVMPTLTTVAAPLTEMGARAVRLALTGSDGPRTETVTTEVILRDSTPHRTSNNARTGVVESNSLE